MVKYKNHVSEYVEKCRDLAFAILMCFNIQLIFITGTIFISYPGGVKSLKSLRGHQRNKGGKLSYSVFQLTTDTIR